MAERGDRAERQIASRKAEEDELDPTELKPPDPVPYKLAVILGLALYGIIIAIYYIITAVLY